MIYFILFVFSIVFTLSVRHIALKKSLLDIPNERSSVVTPSDDKFNDIFKLLFPPFPKVNLVPKPLI